MAYMATERESHHEPRIGLQQDRVQAFLRTSRSTPVADSWFGCGYDVSIGEGAASLQMRVFPEGKVVSFHSGMTRLEIGGITRVAQQANRLCIEGYSGGERVLVELSPTGEFMLIRAPLGGAARILPPTS